MASAGGLRRPVRVPASGAVLDGDLVVPEGARGVVLFAHGSGSSRHSPRNRRVAAGLHDAGLGTLLLDLLTEEEERIDARTRALRFDIDLLAGRLTAAADWLGAAEGTAGLPLATFGASTGAAAALITAADRPEAVRAVVSRGGRPDLAGDALERVRAPTLLVVGGHDVQVLRLNRDAAAHLAAEHEVAVVPGATHLFEEPGALEEVVERTTAWLLRWLRGRPRSRDRTSGRSRARSRVALHRSSGQDAGMDVGWGTDDQWDARPGLDEFLLARIAEDDRVAADAAEDSGRKDWSTDPRGTGAADRRTAEHVARHDPARVHAECAAKRHLVLACRDVRPDMHFLGRRPSGMADFPLSPRDPHQLAALTLALLALPYADHRDYRPEWRP
ncbi:DUF6221 family protein [Geodermatophilus sp. YIM 151500]|uniref:DUF6221 family protein n=1 Tax=Geodermatophilus sp. YIM 151500 TaxID=2984531 RepID=UPI0021E41D19|nr:DUF6221 family protein [Geodermatophilus sp. YIM 151500]MCV2487827.1 DUF6221 family protein [Geodermatophilus sp. YIM 151500]